MRAVLRGVNDGIITVVDSRSGTWSRAGNGHDHGVPAQGGSADAVIGTGSRQTGYIGAVGAGIIRIVTLSAESIHHKVPSDEIVDLAIAIIVDAVDIAAVHHPGRSIVIQGIAVTIGILTHIVPDVFRYIGMHPFDS